MFVNNKIIIDFAVYAIVECNIVCSVGEGKVRTRKFTDKRTHSSKPSDPKRDRSSPCLFLNGCQKLNKLKSLRYTRFSEIIPIQRRLRINTTAQFLVHNADTTLDCVSSHFVSEKNKIKL